MIPANGYMKVKRHLQPKGIVLPDKSEATSDELFEVVEVSHADYEDYYVPRMGDIVAIVGYINTIGSEIFARVKDIVAVTPIQIVPAYPEAFTHQEPQEPPLPWYKRLWNGIFGIEKLG